MIDHLHFTQSVEISRGGGLATSMLSMHAAMLKGGFKSKAVSTYCNQIDVHPSLPQYVNLYKETIKTPFFFSSCLWRDRPLLDCASFYHSHGLHTFVQYFFSASRLNKRSRLVIHPHGFLEPYIVNRSKMKKLLISLAYENNNFREAFLWRALTQVEASQIQQHFPWARITVIPNGVSVPSKSKLSREQRNLIQARFSVDLSNKSVILFLSRLHPKKGVHVLLEAILKLSSMREDFHLIIAGSGDSKYVEQLSKIVYQNSLGNYVTFVGSVSGDTKEALFFSSDIFILPSFSEGLPMAVLEACAHGIPVLFTEYCNLRHLSDDSAGLMCSPDSDSIATALLRMLDCESSELEKRGKSLREFVERNYSWDHIAQSMHNACLR